MSAVEVRLPPMPYGQFDPHTADLQRLRAEYDLIRQERPGSGRVLDAYNRWNQAGLRRHSRDEAERFFAQTVNGPDGHVYWNGSVSFTRNDGKGRAPKRWWWEHKHGRIGSTTLRLFPLCADRSCINPEHYELKHYRAGQHKYTDQQMLGALQVEALRRGHTPVKADWEASKRSPSAGLYDLRFGSWGNACRQAGLEYEPKLVLTDEQLLDAVRLACKTLGRWPTSTEFDRHPAVREALAAAGLGVKTHTLWRRFGSWTAGRKKAGAR